MSEPTDLPAPSEDERATPSEGTIENERAATAEGAVPPERAIDNESTELVERAADAESTAYDEQADVEDSIDQGERADLVEGNVMNERATNREGTTHNERAESREGTDQAERPVDADEPIDFDGPWDRPWMGDFLRALRAMPNVTRAAKHAGVTRQAAQYQRKQNARFAAAWAQATEESLDELEGYSHTIATVGLETVETTVMRVERRNDQGELVTVERKTFTKRGRVISPQMAMFLLSAYRSDKFKKPSRYEHTGKDGGPLEVSTEQGDAAVGALTSAVASIADARAARERAHGGGTG